jgi:hypothetical protein
VKGCVVKRQHDALYDYYELSWKLNIFVYVNYGTVFAVLLMLARYKVGR